MQIRIYIFDAFLRKLVLYSKVFAVEITEVFYTEERLPFHRFLESVKADSDVILTCGGGDRVFCLAVYGYRGTPDFRRVGYRLCGGVDYGVILTVKVDVNRFWCFGDDYQREAEGAVSLFALVN